MICMSNGNLFILYFSFLELCVNKSATQQALNVQHDCHNRTDETRYISILFLTRNSTFHHTYLILCCVLLTISMKCMLRTYENRELYIVMECCVCAHIYFFCSFFAQCTQLDHRYSINCGCQAICLLALPSKTVYFTFLSRTFAIISIKLQRKAVASFVFPFDKLFCPTSVPAVSFTWSFCDTFKGFLSRLTPMCCGSAGQFSHLTCLTLISRL